MAFTPINTGQQPGDRKGDHARDVGEKLNAMLAELYSGRGFTTRLDLLTEAFSASFRDDGAGNLALYVGVAHAVEADQLKIASFDKATGNMLMAKKLGVSVVGNLANGPLSLLTNSLERMRIDAAGNLGIGTTAPAAKLDVQGTALFNYVAGTSGGLLVPLPATYGKPALQAVDKALAALALILNPLGGSVGIGVDPLFKLHVKSGDGTGVLLHGLTKGVRIVFSPTETTIEGIDQTGSGDLQPLTIGGSLVQLTAPLQPKTPNAFDLGRTDLRWKKLWAVDAEFTNSPIVPDVAAGNSSQKAANTRFVQNALAGSAPVIGSHLRGSFTVCPPLHVWGNGQNLSRTTHEPLFLATTIAGTVSVANTLTSATLTLADAEAIAQVQVGMPIEAAGIQAGTTIAARGAATATTLVVTLSLAANATAGANAARVFPNGNGNGTTTFGTADLRDRAGVGRGNMGGTAANRITIVNSSRLGFGGGDQLMQQHLHTKGIPPAGQNLVSVTPQNIYVLQGDGTSYNSSTGSTGGGTSENLPPLIVENAAIYAGV